MDTPTKPDIVTIPPSPISEQQAEFEKYFPVAAEILVVLMVILYLSYYLFAPWYPRIDPNPEKNFPGPVSVEDFLLDCFLLHDASNSADNKDYRSIEKKILGSLQTSEGDRISFAYFGAGTVPNTIQPPSSEQRIIDAEMSPPVPMFKTDFAGLFLQLQETIRADRRAQAAVDRASHADTIIILTDGIPDLTSGPSRCPDPNREFISDAIVKSFKDLVDGSYVTQEQIYVRLILAGAPRECEAEIRGEWQERLGRASSTRAAFQVLSSSELQDIDKALLTPLRRHPRVILSLTYKDQERKNLDQGKDFIVQYSAQSFYKGGELHIDSCIITDVQGTELHFHALSDPNRITTEEDSGVVIAAPDPPSGKLLGKRVMGSIYFRPVSEHKAKLSETSDYSLQLHFAASSTASHEVNPSNFALKPCRYAHQRQEAQNKLEKLGKWPLSIGITFLIGGVLWYVTRKAAVDTKRKKLSTVIERFLVVPHRVWLGVLLIFSIPMAAALFLLESVAVSVGIGIILGLSLFILERYKKSPTISLLCYTIEFLILPFLHLLI